MTRRRGKQNGSAAGARTMEELQLENETMKTLLDQTSRRLLEFEMSAQSSSVALQRSIRHLSNASKGASAAGAGAGDGEKERDREAEERMRRMEEEVLAKVKEMKRMERENEKLKGVVGRYRDRFESIKAGARARRSGEDVAGVAGPRGKKGEERGSSAG